MRKLILGLVLAFAAAGQAFAQTATPTETATVTQTPTSTVTRTPTSTIAATFTAAASTPTAAPIPTVKGLVGNIPEPVRFAAWKFGYADVTFGTCTSNRASATVTVPGIAVGDLFTVEAPNDGSGIIPMTAGTITGNNTVKLLAICSASNSRVTLPYHWWDRTYPDPNKNLGDPGTIP